MFRSGDPAGNRILWNHEIERGDPEHRKRYRIQGNSIGLQGAADNAFRSLLAAIMRGGHLHLPAFAFHHAAASPLFSRHLRVRSHTSHCRRHASHQQEQEGTELAKALHLCQEYSGLANATILTLNPEDIQRAVYRPIRCYGSTWPDGRSHYAWGGHFVTCISPSGWGSRWSLGKESSCRPSGGCRRSRYTPHEVGAARAGRLRT